MARRTLRLSTARLISGGDPARTQVTGRTANDAVGVLSQWSDLTLSSVSGRSGVLAQACTMGRTSAVALGVLLLLLAACAWWGAAVRADSFDDTAVLPAGVRSATLEVPVGTRVVVWSAADPAVPVDGTGAGPRCTARDIAFGQQLVISEPVEEYRRGVLAGGAGRGLDRVLGSRWTPVAVIHTGVERLRLTCDPASGADLAVSPAPVVAEGLGALRHGWTPLAGLAAVLTLAGAQMTGLGVVRLVRVRAAASPVPVTVPAGRQAAGREAQPRVSGSR